jgi:hypothetical protein
MKTFLLTTFLMMSAGGVHAMGSAITVNEFDPEEQIPLGHQASLLCKSESLNGEVPTDFAGTDFNGTLESTDALAR